jgi:hypothetical protein
MGRKQHNSKLTNQTKYKTWILILVLLGVVLAGLYIVRRSSAANADVNGDGTVNITDLSIMAANYGKTGRTFAQGDVNGDGAVTIIDLSILAANWGTTTTGIPQPAGHGQTGGPTGTWSKLDFDDEFSSTNSATCNNPCGLDGSKWRTGWVGGSAPVQGQEWACYNPANVQVTGGYLRLFATDPNPDPSCPKGERTTRPYYSGAVDSGPSRYKSTYGFYEARIWIDADASGNVYNWPAWWITDGAWTNYTGEIDLMEGLSGSMRATLHPDGPIGGNKSCYFNSSGQATQCGALWHTLGADWESNGNVSIYYDGKQVGSTKHYSLTDAQALVLGMQMGPQNQYGGVNKVPSEMRIDYVRVWKH